MQSGLLARGYAAHPACKRVLSTSPRTLLSSFFYDTLPHDARALADLSDVVGPQRLPYGSDYPFEMPDLAGPSRIRDLSASTEVQAATLGGNAQRALPTPSEDAKRSRRP